MARVSVEIVDQLVSGGVLRAEHDVGHRGIGSGRAGFEELAGRGVSLRYHGAVVEQSGRVEQSGDVDSLGLGAAGYQSCHGVLKRCQIRRAQLRQILDSGHGDAGIRRRRETNVGRPDSAAGISRFEADHDCRCRGCRFEVAGKYRHSVVVDAGGHHSVDGNDAERELESV
ncbi:hypothetical protein GCM10020255_060490 [Rhodococcus baikonurensis]